MVGVALGLGEPEGRSRTTVWNGGLTSCQLSHNFAPVELSTLREFPECTRTGSGVKGKKILFRTGARGWGPRSLLSSAAGVRPSERVQTAKLIFLLTKSFTESSIRVFF